MSDIDKIRGVEGILRFERPDSVQSSKNNAAPSEFTDTLKSAMRQLSELDDRDKLREDAISNGKAIIKNWQPPTNEQIDKIFMKMKNELMA
jgi:predicted ArsR family transcriptional regulator